MTKICTRCLLQDFDRTKYETLIVKSIEDLPKEDIASDDVRQGRLALCRECAKLNQGTCLACGCFVEIRAALVRGKCPYRKW